MEIISKELEESSESIKKQPKSSALLAWLIPQVNYIRSTEGQN